MNFMRRIFTLCFAGIFLSCSEATAPEQLALSGTVQLQDAWGNRLSDYSGVRVSVEGTNLQANTAANGHWQIKGVAPGRAALKFEKNGFGGYRIPNLSVESDLDIRDTTFLAPPPSQMLVIDQITVSTEYGDSAYVVKTHLSSPPPSAAMWSIGLLFVGTDASISPAVTKHKVAHASINFGAPSELIFVVFLKDYRSQFQKGQTLYARGYAYSNACSCYDDDVTGLRVYPNTGPPSNIVSFEML